MPNQPISTLVDSLGDCQLLDANQLAVARTQLAVQAATPHALAELLVARGWLTAFQAEEVLHGRARELQVGPYRLIDLLGQGGMGQVFKAWHRPMNRIVALKIIRKELLANPDAVQRFYREIQAAAQLVHPNIVLAYDAGQAGDTHYFAMEYVEGTDLSRVVKETGPLPVAAACDYIRQAALGLQHSFERGLVHRDIKPSNLILVSGRAVNGERSKRTSATTDHPPPTTPQIKILDLGLARLQKPDAAEQTLTHEGAVLGTPAYIAPEQALNARVADIRSDLYSLGCSLYYLLTARPPFAGQSVTEVLLKHQVEPAIPVSSLRPEVPAGVARVLEKLMAKHPQDRYATPAQLAEALLPFCTGPDTTLMRAAVPPATPGEASGSTERLATKVRPSFKRPPKSVLLAGSVALVLLGAGCALGIWLSRGGTTGHAGGARSSASQTADNGVSTEANPGGQAPGECRFLQGHKGPVRSVRFTPSGNRALSTGDDSTIRLWSLADGKELKSLTGHTGAVTAIALSADGKLAVSGGRDRSVRIWELPAGKERFCIHSKRHEADISGVAVSPDGQIALSVDLNSWYMFWNTDSGKEAGGEGGGTRGAIYGVTFASIEPNIFGYACADGIAYIDRIRSKPRPRVRLRGHDGKVLCLAISADGQRVLTGGVDRTLRLWDAETGKQLFCSPKLDSPVWSVAFSSDGLRAITGSGSYLEKEGERVLKNGQPVPVDCTVRLWDLNKLRELHSFTGYAGPVWGVALAPDGRQVLSGSDDGTLRLWQVPPVLVATPK
jgi:serine/threonine protein kinase